MTGPALYPNNAPGFKYPSSTGQPNATPSQALYPNNAAGFEYPNTDALLGVGSEVDQKEWEIFLRRRQELANSIMGRIQMGQQTGLPQPVVDANANQTEQQP